MVKALTDVLQQHRVPFIVAPYEADAQLAYLALQGMVHAVISEDSDMLVYGCPRVLFKLDGRTGIGHEIVIANLPHNHRPSFRGWDHSQFVQLCILMGCDFLKSPKGIGDKKAYQLMQRLRSFTKVLLVFVVITTDDSTHPNRCARRCDDSSGAFSCHQAMRHAFNGPYGRFATSVSFAQSSGVWCISRYVAA